MYTIGIVFRMAIIWNIYNKTNMILPKRSSEYRIVKQNDYRNGLSRVNGTQSATNNIQGLSLHHCSHYTLGSRFILRHPVGV